MSDTMIQTAGVTVDNYKIEKYVKTLEKAGFTIDRIVPFPVIGNCSIIKIKTHKKNFVEIMKICKKLEIDFKRSN